jgi:hypothetical protein
MHTTYQEKQMTWRVAKSLDKLRSQVNAQWPKRDKSSDGTIGDERHQASTSDHNPWVKDGKMGVVTGMDITNDPTGGPVSNDLAETLKASRDPRIKYIISNARICSGDAGPSPWVWRKYSGANAHRHHVHISVKSEKSSYDSVRAWALEPKAVKFIEPVAAIEDPPPSFLKPGPVGVDVAVTGDPEVFSVQKRLKARNYSPGLIDGLWGSGTAGAVSGFINDRGGKIPAPASLDAFNSVREDIKAELQRAESEGWFRPVTPARASGDAATVAAVAPEVVPVKRNFLAAAWASFLSFLAAIWNWLSDAASSAWDFFTDHKDDVPTDSGFLHSAWEWVTGLPPAVWAIGIGAVFLFIALNSRTSANKITESVSSGARQ